MTFEESDLQFHFLPAYWRVKKYDTHRYFKILSGAGLKGVDFLGILQEKEVIFFEVKNYRTHHPTKPPSYLIFEDTEAFINRITNKLKDTLQAINIIHLYLERKWWFRWYLKWEQYLPNRIIQDRDWYFWYQVYKIGQHSHRRTLVLWLEIDHHYAPFSRVKLKALLDKALEKELSSLVEAIEIADLDAPVFRQQLKVRKQWNST